MQDQSSHDHGWKIILNNCFFKKDFFIKELSQQDQSNDYPSENQSDAGRSAKAMEELEKGIISNIAFGIFLQSFISNI